MNFLKLAIICKLELASICKLELASICKLDIAIICKLDIASIRKSTGSVWRLYLWSATHCFETKVCYKIYFLPKSVSEHTCADACVRDLVFRKL